MLGNIENLWERRRTEEESDGIRYAVMCTWSHLSAELFLFLFASVTQEHHHQALLMCQLLYLASLSPTLMLCCRYCYKPILQRGKRRLRGAQSLEI